MTQSVLLVTDGNENIGYDSSMQMSSSHKGAVAQDESVAAFTSRARRILAQAKAMSAKFDDGNIELNRWMDVAKGRGMTWVEGLYFAVDSMKQAMPSDEAT